MDTLFEASPDAETALRESQRLLASVADNISEAIYRSAPDHSLTFVNRAYLRLFGYSSFDQLSKIPCEQLYVDPAIRLSLIEKLAKHDAFGQEEVQYRRKDGSTFWGLSSAQIIRDPESGLVSYQVGAITDITARKEAEAEIRRLNQSLENRIVARTAELTASEARLRTLVEHAPEAIVVFDGDTGRFIFGNAHACAIYDVPPEKLPLLTPADVSPEFQPGGRRSEDAAREKMKQALAGETPVFEWVHRQPNGKLVPTEVRLIRLPGEGTNLVRASIIDTTERKRRESTQQATFQISEAVHTTEDLESLFGKIHSIVKGLMPAENLFIALLDPGGQTFNFPYMVDQRSRCSGPLHISKGLTGYVLRTGKPLLAGPHNSRSPGAGIHFVLEGGEQVEAVGGNDPGAVWLGAPLSIAGKTFGVIAVQDYENPQAYGEQEKRMLTFVAGQIALAIERKRAEEALRESEEKFRVLFEASSQGVMLHDEEHYLQVNPAAARILGYSDPVELMGKHPGETSPPFQPSGEPSREYASKLMAQCMSEGSARFDWLARSADGRDIPLEVILTRIEWAGRQVIQAVINDITARKHAEAELLRALAREKELGQLKSNFVSMVSHEFRTPLGVIMSSAEILESYFSDLEAAERLEHLHSIQKSTRRMAALMEEVLLLGMVEAGKMDFRPRPLNLQVFCERVIGEVLAATHRKCSIHFHGRDLPSIALTDERLLGHIFNNLLSNAVKYSNEGSAVQLDVRREADQAICRFTDQGIGIPEADLAWIFRSFHRGRNVGHLPGSGLGLSIVKRCVELHHGSIQVSSILGQGTTVELRLPLFKSE